MTVHLISLQCSLASCNDAGRDQQHEKKYISEENSCLQASLLPKNESGLVQFVKVQRAPFDE